MYVWGAIDFDRVEISTSRSKNVYYRCGLCKENNRELCNVSYMEKQQCATTQKNVLALFGCLKKLNIFVPKELKIMILDNYITLHTCSSD
jgi:hypothetical protein